jgi:hypothetical protein
MPVSPVVSENFTNGVWSGNLAVLQSASNVTLRASAGTGHYSQSLSFDVIDLPKLTIAVVGKSAVLSWPTATAGFTLKQSFDLSNWTTVPLTPAVVGDRFTVTNSLDATRNYYRLRKP